MKIGLFGGTFNPPHMGHIRAAECFAREAELDLLYIMPSALPPHKEIEGTDIPSHRFCMARMAFKDIPCKTVVSAIELSRSGKSYSIDTVNELLALHTNDCDGRIYMYIGSDMLFSFEEWKHFEELFEKCIIVTAARDESSLSEVSRICEDYRRKYGCRYKILSLSPLDISSTYLRSTSYDSEKKYLTDNIRRYIIENDIYAQKKHVSDITDEQTLAVIEQDVTASVDQKRLSHIRGVTDTAIGMAQRYLSVYGYGQEYISDIKAAALLHDITKCKENAWHEQFLSEFMCGYRGYQPVYHSWSGAYTALTKYKANTRVFRAVYSHTTARADMDIFEKIIFFADYIEPGREHGACVEMRRKYFELTENEKDTDKLKKILDMLILEVLENTYSHLKEKQANIHPAMFCAMDFLKNEV